ncbi:ATP-dependent helicase [Verminephrobacter aporrectodeae subsp. tuberculatae]|uniref:DNA 3'-5' helicase II n=1 Tax=Verminephrobacter aporrectodeae subsp. tuberculatae TaxID=1110392 RepID=A0ABT3KUW1_9BURK|nr:ATP-dependent helicase [Verminephrobacter aporrectodeae]MCW5322016.1 ATP-dependent helicase [Verminephrobacter aporrectodeae subsp. tuberculatae]MCW8200095.1 ATP-dependent helicase [Verminephrobacter aporrectodeae subsp. tuberculatae]
MTTLSPEQQAIIDAPLDPLSVVACAGSGKTLTAVRRLIEVRKRLGDHRGRVALLSFSNVAVKTFQSKYQALAQNLPAGIGRDRIEIDTLDGFITSNILRPHAYRTMGTTRTAFLVMGNEPFLKRFTFKVSYSLEEESHPLCITKMHIGLQTEDVCFYYANNNQKVALDTAYALNIVNCLGRNGAYTHNLGRYWCHRVLSEQPAILRALARRYPHILIDESQDINTLHQAILEQLMKAGTKISLIGDPSQGIYEFAGANCDFLTQYEQRPAIKNYALTRNYRSVPSIVELANNLSGRSDTADRAAPETLPGAFFIAYKNENAERERLVAAFGAAVLAAGLKRQCSAILCRGRGDLLNELSGNAPIGQGLVKGFAKAAILRDKLQDYLSAFETIASCVAGLLADPPDNLVAMITRPASYPEARSLRREVWKFTRNQDTGLPSALLAAKSRWHTLLLERSRNFLALLQDRFDLETADNLGRKLAKTKLLDAPLMVGGDLVTAQDARIRVDTVHQVKGESLDAVLYLAARKDVVALLGGVKTEEGRIGYVAVTRARNLLWLGVPANSLEELRPELLSRGFQEHLLSPSHP